MASSRENPKHTSALALRDILGRAFSKTVCGTDLHNRFHEWDAYLLTNTTEQKEIERHQKELIESKKVKSGSTLQLNRLSTTLHCVLAEKFSQLKKLTSPVASLLELTGHTMRIAASIDLVEHLENENDLYKKSLLEKKASLSLVQRPDLLAFNADKFNFTRKYTKSYPAEINESALAHFKDQLRRHAQEEKLIDDEIDKVEEAIAREPSQSKALKTALIAKIAEKKAQLKADMSLTLDKKDELKTILPPFNRAGIFKKFQDEYNDLNQKISGLNDYYEQQQKSEFKTFIPNISGKTVAELFTIQNTSMLERKLLAATLANIEKTLNENRPTWFFQPAEWNELKKFANDQQHIWCQEKKDLLSNRENISVRVQTIQQERSTLILQAEADNKARIRRAESDQYALADETMALRTLYQKFCQRVNEDICKAYNAISQANQKNCKSQQSKYDALKKRVNAIEAPKFSKRPAESKGSATATLLSQKMAAPKPKSSGKPRLTRSQIALKHAKSSGFFGAVAVAACIVSLTLITFPVGLIAGCGFGLLGLGSWAHSFMCYRSSRSNHPVSLRAEIPLVSMTAEHKEMVEPSTNQIKQSLNQNPIEMRLRALGLDPKKAKSGPQGSMHFSLKNGRILQFSSYGMRLYDHTADRFIAIESKRIPDEIDREIRDTNRLARH